MLWSDVGVANLSQYISSHEHVVILDYMFMIFFLFFLKMRVYLYNLVTTDLCASTPNEKK